MKTQNKYSPSRNKFRSRINLGQ